MAQPAEVMVFLLNTIKDKEDELITLQILNDVVPVMKELNDNGG